MMAVCLFGPSLRGYTETNVLCDTLTPILQGFLFLFYKQDTIQYFFEDRQKGFIPIRCLAIPFAC